MFKDSQSGNPEKSSKYLDKNEMKPLAIQKMFQTDTWQFMLCICVYIYKYYIVARSYLDYSEYTMHNY